MLDKLITKTLHEGFYPHYHALDEALGILAAGLFCKLMNKRTYWESIGQLQPDSSFYWVVEEIEQQTGLTRKMRQNAIEILIKSNLIEIKKYGLPSKNYYKINDNRELDIMRMTKEERVELRVKLLESDKQVCTSSTVLQNDTLLCTEGTQYNVPRVQESNITITKITDREAEKKEIVRVPQQIPPQKPSIESIFNSWITTVPMKGNFYDRDYRLQSIQDLTNMIKIKGYNQDDIPISIKKKIISMWAIAKDKVKLQWAIEKTENDWNIACGNSWPVELTREDRVNMEIAKTKKQFDDAGYDLFSDYDANEV